MQNDVIREANWRTLSNRIMKLMIGCVADRVGDLKFELAVIEILDILIKMGQMGKVRMKRKQMRKSCINSPT